MAELHEKQLRLHRSIEKFLDNFKKIGKGNWTPPKVRSRISALKELWGQYQEGHDFLVRDTPTTSQASIEYFNSCYYEDAENIYHATLDSLTESLEELDPIVSPHQSFLANSTRLDTPPSALPVLPAIHLPQFSGKYEDWEQFRDQFTALIRENKELTNFSRMHYLLSCVKGRALECISDLPITADSFVIAWQTLTARFEKKRRLLNGHLESLLTLPTVSREQASELQNLLDKVKKTVASLRNLNRTSENLWNDLLVYIIVQHLDPITCKAWNLKTGDTDEPPAYDSLKNFLTHRINALDTEMQPKNVAVSSKSGKTVRVNVSTASPDTLPSCPLCSDKHFLYSCSAFINKTPYQRRDLVRTQNRCFNCLSTKHAVKECRSKYSCRICRKKHHSLLHVTSDANQSSAETKSASSAIAPTPPLTPPPEINSLLASIPPQSRSYVLLATAWITVESADRSIVVRALIDQGSEMTFITEQLAQTLRAKKIRMPVSVSGVGGMHAGIVRSAANISISPQHSLTPRLSTTALIMRSLTSYAPKRNYELTNFSHLAGITWADKNPMSSDPISIIIGADLYDILLDGVRKGHSGQPIAQNSIFEWIISGPLGITQSHAHLAISHDGEFTSDLGLPQDTYFNVAAHHCLSASLLDRAIRRFWETEELPRAVPATADDDQCEQHFQKTHTRDSDGRYVMRLPFKTGPPIDIGESKIRAERVLNSLRRRLHSSPDQEKEYREFMTEYEQLGHMWLASETPRRVDQIVYIPHHAVVRESSATTRLRVVVNASSVTSNGSTLNDHLLAGPKLQTDVNAIILRWRNYKYAYTTDIAKMYRQIRVDERDVDYQRILWNDNQTAQTREYQLITVTYGTACAPYLALRVLKQLVNDDGERYPLAVSVLRENTYVDDTLFGADDLTTARQIRDQITELLKKGGFDLRKWASNSSDLLSDIDEKNHGLACDKRLASNEKLNILGLGWNPALDTFKFQVTLPAQIPATKRTVLSVIAKLYDPMGWVTPVIISAKIFMQTLWQLNLD